MRKHRRPILFTLLSLNIAFVYACPTAKADQSFHRQMYTHPHMEGTTPYSPTPEQKAHDEKVSRLVQRAEKLLDQNDLHGARQAAEEALRIAGNQKPVSDEQVLLAEKLAPIYLRTGQYKRAAALFGPHSDLGRNLSLNEAIALVKTGRLADARKCWRESQMLPYHKNVLPYLPPLSSAKGFEATVFLCHGIADVDQSHPMNGIWALHHAIQLIPNNPLALWYYGEAFANAGRSGEARHFFEAAITLDHGFVARRARESMARLDRTRGR